MRYLPSTALPNLEVLDFSMLAERILETYGGRARAELNHGEKTLLMWDTLQEVFPVLTEYNHSKKGDISLSSLLLSTVEELRDNACSPSRLDKLLDTLPEDHPLHAKLHDLSVIYAYYQSSLRENLKEEFTDKAARSVETLYSHNFFDNTHVFLDSFTHFNATEYKMIEHFFRQGKSVSVTLCIDSLSSQGGYSVSMDSLKETAARLKKTAADCSLPVEEISLPERINTSSRELILLEKELWQFNLTEADRVIPEEKDRGSIHLIRARNPYEEAESVALNILELVQNGYGFSDIAVVARNAESYRGILDSTLEKYAVPFFFSEKITLSSRPAARLILSALRAVTFGFQKEDLTALLHTGLLSLSLREIDLFEDYCSTWRINGKDFRQVAWSMNPDGYETKLSERGKLILDAANRVRQEVMKDLLPLETEMKEAETMEERSLALCRYMLQISLSDRLKESAEKSVAEANYREANETLRLFDTILQAMTHMVQLLGSRTVSSEEYLALLELQFRETELASVPAMLDYVTIGSASSLHLENNKIMFVLGLCEGEFPQSLLNSSLFTEEDKKQLDALGLKLYSDFSTRSSDELFFAYRTLTKPTDHLYLYTNREDAGQTEKAPSIVFRRVQFLFPYLTVENYRHDAVFKMPAATAEPEPETSPCLPQDLVSDVFGDHLFLSKTKINSFVNCPYSFYADNVLHLREPLIASMAASDAGTFLHLVLERFLKSAFNEDGELTVSLSDRAEVQKKADEIVAGYLAVIQKSLRVENNARIAHHFLRLRNNAVDIIRCVLEEFEKSRFRPIGYEVKIGSHGPDSVEPFTCSLSNDRQVSVSGSIDRLDAYSDPGSGETFFRVIDYKTGDKEFSLEKALEGKDIQLLLYLFSALQKPVAPGQYALPAGTMYLSCREKEGKIVCSRSGILLNRPDILSAMNRDLDKDILLKVKIDPETGAASGKSLLSSEEFRQLQKDTEDLFRRIGEDVYSGRLEKTPSEDACRFCPVRESCGKATPERRR